MGENIIQSVGPNDSDPRGTAMYQMFQNQLFKTSDSASPVTAVQPEKTDKSARPEKVEEKPAQSLLPITNNDTFLKFMVDKKTNDITVYVVDRASHRVMRSIPPTDVNNLKAGDLLKLLA